MEALLEAVDQAQYSAKEDGSNESGNASAMVKGGCVVNLIKLRWKNIDLRGGSNMNNELHSGAFCGFGKIWMNL